MLDKAAILKASTKCAEACVRDSEDYERAMEVASG